MTTYGDLAPGQVYAVKNVGTYVVISVTRADDLTCVDVKWLLTNGSTSIVIDEARLSVDLTFSSLMRRVL